MDKERFKDICDSLIKIEPNNNRIGTMKEKTLHLVIKEYFATEGSLTEYPVLGHYADVFKNDLIIEIQTAHLNKLRKKLDTLLKEYKVMVVYPIIHRKWLYWIDPDNGEISKKRLSPRKGTIYDCFRELYKIKFHLSEPNLHLCLMLVDVEEYKMLNGYSEDRKKGASKVERYPKELHFQLHLNSIKDYLCFLPITLPSIFTTKDYASVCNINLKKSQIALHILCHLGVIVKIGKERNLIRYQINDKYRQELLINRI